MKVNVKVGNVETILKDYQRFTKLVGKGLLYGAKKYGTEGFLGDSQLAMLEEELRDLSAYSYLLFRKVQLLKVGFLKVKDLKECTGESSINEFKKKKKREAEVEKKTKK